jgi:hypothetical protein
MVVMVARGREDHAVALCRDLGVPSVIVGDVVEGSGVKLG